MRFLSAVICLYCVIISPFAQAQVSVNYELALPIVPIIIETRIGDSATILIDDDSGVQKVELSGFGTNSKNPIVKALLRLGYRAKAFFAVNSIEFYLKSGKEFADTVEAFKIEKNQVAQNNLLISGDNSEHGSEKFRGFREIYELVVVSELRNAEKALAEEASETSFRSFALKNYIADIQQLTPYILASGMRAKELTTEIRNSKETIYKAIDFHFDH